MNVLSLKTAAVNIPKASKNNQKNLFFVGVLKATEEKSRILIRNTGILITFRGICNKTFTLRFILL
jgi:hypothetical protein